MDTDVYECMKIENNYPDSCDEWWEFWKFKVNEKTDTFQDIMESWEEWLDEDDPYPCQDEW